MEMLRNSKIELVRCNYFLGTPKSNTATKHNPTNVKGFL